MTQDFKDKILKYLTGNLDEEPGNNTPQFEQLETITNNLSTYVDQRTQGGGAWTTNPKEIIQGKDGNGNDLDIYALACNDIVTGVYYGFIVILDSEFNPIQFINSYSSGVRLGKIVSIKVDYTGAIYLVEYSNDSSKYRIVLLNNILMKLPTQREYQCKIRTSYFLPNELQITFNTLEVFKSYTDDNYGFICNTDTKLIVETLKIEVGLANDWTNYTYDYSSLGFLMNYIDGACYFSEDSFNFRALLYQAGNTNVYKFYLNGSSLTYSLIDISDFLYSNQFTVLNAVILQEELYYFGICSFERQNSSYTGNQNNMIIKYTNGLLELINSISTTDNTMPLNKFYFYLKNNIPFYRFFYKSGDQYNCNVGLIANNVASYFTIENIGGTQPGFYSYEKAFIVTMTYNLLTYYVPYSSYEQFYKCQQIFNQYNYNGVAYENVNSMVPNSGVIYDNNGNIIFARNLYNLNINGNTTISTIEVPNTFLNDVTIGQEDLISQTNGVLNQETNSITTNIYENLDFNFFNTLVMKNDNTPNEIINNEGASRLNNSISQTTDYSDATANKIRINYQDGTSLVQNVSTPIITNGVATYTISIYVPKAITNIEIISNDENTSYQTITGTFTIGNYYTLTQDVRVE